MRREEDADDSDEDAGSSTEGSRSLIPTLVVIAVFALIGVGAALGCRSYDVGPILVSGQEPITDYVRQSDFDSYRQRTREGLQQKWQYLEVQQAEIKRLSDVTAQLGAQLEGVQNQLREMRTPSQSQAAQPKSGSRKMPRPLPKISVGGAPLPASEQK